MLPLLWGYQRLGAVRLVPAFTRGLTVASVGLIFAATLSIGQATLTGWVSVLVFAAAVVGGRTAQPATRRVACRLGRHRHAARRRRSRKYPSRITSRWPERSGGGVLSPTWNRRIWEQAMGHGPGPAAHLRASGLPSGAASDLVEETFMLAGRTVRMLRPRDGDAVLDELLAEEDPDEDRLPFWAELWPSGAALARALTTQRLAGLRVLELGCGLGLVSVTAALAGARVLAVDRSPEGIAFTAANAAHNGVTLQTAVCAFDQPEPLLAGAPWDLVLAADVLYEPRNVPVLLWLLPRLVDASGEVWLADPGRRMQATFLAGMDATGWHCKRLPGEPDTVAILRLRRRESGVAVQRGRTGR